MDNITTNFYPNDRVVHPEFGFGTILECDENGRLSVRFDRYGTKWLVLKYAQLRRVTAEEEGAVDAASSDWLNTFEFEESGNHAFGARWEPFFDDAGEFVGRLPQILPEAKLRQGYGDFYPPSRVCPSHWPKVSYLAWPDIHQGVLLAIKINEQGASELVSLFPFWESGTEHTVTLDRVVVWPGGAEAQVECVIGDAEVTFFDALYAINRGWYVSGGEYQFVLTGIAYNSRVAKDEVFDISGEKLGEILRKIEGIEGGAPDDPEISKIHTRGMAMLIPIPQWDADDYHFRGPIKAVREIEMLGQPGWLVRATLLRAIGDDREFDFDIVITRRVWESAAPPQPGQDIEGAMWLQGYLWSAVAGGFLRGLDTSVPRDEDRV